MYISGCQEDRQKFFLRGRAAGLEIYDSINYWLLLINFCRHFCQKIQTKVQIFAKIEILFCKNSLGKNQYE